MIFMTDDITNFYKSIAVDPVIQELIQKNNFTNEFQRVKNNQLVADRLVFYNSLRNYIGTSVLVAADSRYYSSRGFQGELYYQTKFNNKWMKQYMNSEDMLFSNPYHAIEVDTASRVMCYQTTLQNIEKPSQIIGQLFLDINMSYFEKQLKQYAKEYQSVLWIGSTKDVIFESGDSETGSNILNQIDVQHLSPIHKIKGGYLISEDIKSPNWTLCTFITDDYLWKQSQFVMYFFLLFLF